MKRLVAVAAVVGCSSSPITEFPLPTANAAPYGIATGGDGAVWFTEQIGNIGRITREGVVTEYAVPTAGALPYHLAADQAGDLWFTEKAGNQIGHVDSASGAIT